MANGLNLEISLKSINPTQLALSPDLENMQAIRKGLDLGLVIPKEVEKGTLGRVDNYKIEAKTPSNNVATLQITGPSGDKSFISFKNGQLLITGDKKQAQVVLKILAEGMSEVTEPGLDPRKPYAKAKFNIGDTGAKVLDILKKGGIKGEVTHNEAAHYFFPKDTLSKRIPTDSIMFSFPWSSDTISIDQNEKKYFLNITTGEMTNNSDPPRTIKLSEETKIQVLQGKNDQLQVLINNQPIEQAFNKARAGNQKPTEPLF